MTINSLDWKDHIERELHTKLQTLDENYEWEPQQPIVGSSGLYKVDVRGIYKLDKNKIIYIEIESARTTCVRNILKIWMNLVETKSDKEILFIHVLSPIFNSEPKKYLRGKAESIFIGQQAQEDTDVKFTYKNIQLNDWLPADKLAPIILSETKK
jgi:hypothetical protein